MSETEQRAREVAAQAARSDACRRGPVGHGYADPVTGEEMGHPYCGGDRPTWRPAPGAPYVRATHDTRTGETLVAVLRQPE